MTRPLRTARVCQAVTVTLIASALYGASIHPVLALPGLGAAALFAWSSTSFLAEHREIVATHEAARRAAAGTPVDIPPPCCSYWFESAGAFHGEDCTRPTDARTDDYRLAADEQVTFDAIATDFDDRGAA